MSNPSILLNIFFNFKWHDIASHWFNLRKKIKILDINWTWAGDKNFQKIKVYCKGTLNRDVHFCYKCDNIKKESGITFHCTR